jgi:hypothetical protein
LATFGQIRFQIGLYKIGIHYVCSGHAAWAAAAAYNLHADLMFGDNANRNAMGFAFDNHYVIAVFFLHQLIDLFQREILCADGWIFVY